MQLLMQKLILITSLSRPINASDFIELGKNAALDLEYIAKRLRNARDYDKISKVIDMLIEEFAKSPQANHRKLEYIAKRLRNAGDYDKISKIIDMLIEEFVKSPQANHRKGDLIGLAAVTLGLSSEAAQRYLEQIVPLVINSFSDQDSRVRYYACEALYNIAKAVRCEFLIFFNQTFDALCKLSADNIGNLQQN